MIVDDSLSRLTKRTMIVHDSFPKNRWARLKWPPREVSAAASEIHVYIQGHNHDKKNIEDQDNTEKISSEESVNSQELEETPQKRSISLNVHWVRWAMRRDGVMT